MSTLVFREYDAEEFERQYNARVLVPDCEEIVAQLTERSRAYRDSLDDAALDQQYGTSARERLDVFPSPQEKSPVLLYIHGGYWRDRNKDSYSFIAEALAASGVTVVVCSYSHCPHVTLGHIVRQMRAVCGWIWKNIEDHNGSAHKLYVCGNSAGGHLSAMLAATDWSEVDLTLPEDLIKGAASLSGLFDLEPLLLHSVNQTLNLSAESARRHSPIHLQPTLGGPFLCAVGGAESAEFKRQSRDFSDAWGQCDAAIEYFEVPDRNHFSIVTDLTDQDYVLLLKLKVMLGV